MSLLSWFGRMISTLRESPEIGVGSCSAIDRDLPPGVFVHRAEARTGSMLFVHNLGAEATKIDLHDLYTDADRPRHVFSDRPYDDVGDLSALDIAGFGYRWIRLRRSPVG